VPKSEAPDRTFGRVPLRGSAPPPYFASSTVYADSGLPTPSSLIPRTLFLFSLLLPRPGSQSQHLPPALFPVVREAGYSVIAAPLRAPCDDLSAFSLRLSLF